MKAKLCVQQLCFVIFLALIGNAFCAVTFLSLSSVLIIITCCAIGLIDDHEAIAKINGYDARCLFT